MEKNAPAWYLYHSGVDQRYWRKVRRKIWRGVEAGVDLESNAMIWKLYWQRNVCVAKRWVRRPVQTLVRWEPLFIALKVSVFPLVSSHSNKIYVYWMLVVVQRGVDHIWLGISLEEDDSKRSRPYLIGNLIGRGRFKEESTIFDWEIGISESHWKRTSKYRKFQDKNHEWSRVSCMMWIWIGDFWFEIHLDKLKPRSCVGRDCETGWTNISLLVNRILIHEERNWVWS